MVASDAFSTPSALRFVPTRCRLRTRAKVLAHYSHSQAFTLPGTITALAWKHSPHWLQAWGFPLAWAPGLWEHMSVSQHLLTPLTSTGLFASGSLPGCRNGRKQTSLQWSSFARQQVVTSWWNPYCTHGTYRILSSKTCGFWGSMRFYKISPLGPSF